ncbi:MAG: hypothetical protein D6797_07710 [Bdellovibrio sp.]|nr:MAG: hypothetical protein D6797_07710 [Bdellovibrio sp.]
MGVLMFSQLTIRNRFFILNLIGVVSVFLLGGITVFSFFNIKKFLIENNLKLKKKNQSFIQLGLDLEKTDAVFNVIIASQGKGSLSSLSELKAIEKDVTSTLNRLEKENIDENFKKAVKNARGSYEKMLETGKKTALAFLNGNKETALPLAEKLKKLSSENRKNVKEISDVFLGYQKQIIFRYLDTSMSYIFMLGLFLLIAGGILGFILYKKTNFTLNNISREIYLSAERNKKVTGEMQEISERLADSSKALASSVLETVSAVDEITATSEQSNQYAETSVSKVKGSEEISEKGQQKVLEVIDAMNGINQESLSLMNNVKENNEKISSIVKIIDNISEKTNIINDIVFQTKLLSFNASVEAARAGEQGKGFAVVAEEVGNLAQLSGVAAKEIKEMLAESVEQVNRLVLEANQCMEDVLKAVKFKVESGVELAKECGEILAEVVQNSKEITSVMTEIKNASEEQQTGLTNISKAMRLIDEHVQKMEEISSESNLCVESLGDEVLILRRHVASLNTLIKKQEGKLEEEGGASKKDMASLEKEIESNDSDLEEHQETHAA